MSAPSWNVAQVPHPVTVEAAEEPLISRGLWLVKWLLAVPHYVALCFVGIGAVFMWLWALFSILFTGRYPRTAFDYLLGVMRWAWRLQYYLYDAAGTDLYPPFTLSDRPDYPARLDVRYPERLSRGLVLVKWWLLAIPHYIVLAIMFGTTDGNNGQNQGGNVTWAGFVPIMVLIALLAVLFTGRYPKPLYDLVLGFDRWEWRVVAYVALMTDVYPPFRLDQGPFEPAGPRLTSAYPPPPPGPAFPR